MIEILDFTTGNLMATRIENKMEKDDLDIIHKEIHKILDRGEKICWYFEMKDFHG